MQIRNRNKLLLILFFGLFYQISTAQDKDNSIFIIPEIVVGKTLEANTFFPETKLQKDLFLSLGKYNFESQTTSD